MRKKPRLGVLIAGGTLLLIAAGLLLLYQASQQVPEFYRAAIQLDPASQTQASDEMLQRASALVSDLKKVGRWQAVFTAEQINGWLAVDLVKNHPGALPECFQDLRVGIQQDRLLVACRFRRGWLTSVVWLVIEPYRVKPNVLALRIRKARAGWLPMPLDSVLEGVSGAIRRSDFRLEWRQADGDPVALISIPPPRDQDNQLVDIESLRVGEGKIHLVGTTRRR